MKRSPILGFLLACFLWNVYSDTTPTAIAQTGRVGAVKVKTQRIGGTISTSGWSYTYSASISVGPQATLKSNTKLYWDGHSFMAKTDTGRIFAKVPCDKPFKKQKSVRFVVERKVTLTNGNLISTSFNSKTFILKRGVPATF